MEIIAMKKQLKMLQNEVLLRGKSLSQENHNVGDDKADIFEGSGGKASGFDEVTKDNGDKLHDDIDMSKVSQASGEKAVNKEQVKQDFTPFDHKTSFNDGTVNYDGSSYGTAEFVGTVPTTEPIEAQCNSVGVYAMKLYTTLNNVDCLYWYWISFTLYKLYWLLWNY